MRAGGLGGALDVSEWTRSDSSMATVNQPTSSPSGQTAEPRPGRRRDLTHHRGADHLDRPQRRRVVRLEP